MVLRYKLLFWLWINKRGSRPRWRTCRASSRLKPEGSFGRRWRSWEIWGCSGFLDCRAPSCSGTTRCSPCQCRSYRRWLLLARGRHLVAEDLAGLWSCMLCLCKVQKEAEGRRTPWVWSRIHLESYILASARCSRTHRRQVIGPIYSFFAQFCPGSLLWNGHWCLGTCTRTCKYLSTASAKPKRYIGILSRAVRTQRCRCWRGHKLHKVGSCQDKKASAAAHFLARFSVSWCFSLTMISLSWFLSSGALAASCRSRPP